MRVSREVRNLSFDCTLLLIESQTVCKQQHRVHALAVILSYRKTVERADVERRADVFWSTEERRRRRRITMGEFEEELRRLVLIIEWRKQWCVGDGVNWYIDKEINAGIILLPFRMAHGVG